MYSNSDDNKRKREKQGPWGRPPSTCVCTTLGLEGLVSLLVLLPEPGTLTMFPFSKHRPDPYSAGLLAVRTSNQKYVWKVFWTPKCYKNVRYWRVLRCVGRGKKKKELRVEGMLHFTEQIKMLRSQIRCVFPNPSGFYSAILRWTYCVFLKSRSQHVLRFIRVR